MTNARPRPWLTGAPRRASSTLARKEDGLKGSDDEVIAHVARSRGGIGYVSVSTPLPPTVKELPVEGVIR